MPTSRYTELNQGVPENSQSSSNFRPDDQKPRDLDELRENSLTPDISGEETARSLQGQGETPANITEPDESTGDVLHSETGVSTDERGTSRLNEMKEASDRGPESTDPLEITNDPGDHLT